MNRTKIEWTDYTWNPVTGCRGGCEYCYARKMAKRLKGRAGYPLDDPFMPVFHQDRINEPYCLKKPSRIFTVSMGDLFGDGIIKEVVWDVMKVIIENPRHTFQVLTKRPENIMGLTPDIRGFPPNLWLGVSITNHDQILNARILNDVDKPGGWHRFISFEPLQGRIDHFDGSYTELAIIGAETGNRKNKVIPDIAWVEHLARQCEAKKIPIIWKNNIMSVHQNMNINLIREGKEGALIPWSQAWPTYPKPL